MAARALLLRRLAVFAAAVTLAATGFALTRPVLAQESGSSESETPIVDATAAEDAEPVDLTEMTIYIPYSKLRQVFEVQGRGVFLPYEQFRQLWEAAQKLAQPEAKIEPPVKAVITEIDSQAEVSSDVVHVSAKARIEMLTKGWHRVPLRLRDAALLSAKIGDTAALVVFDGAGGYELLAENASEGAVTVELALEYAKAYTKVPGQNSVSFEAPQAPVNRWRLRLPQSGVRVAIRPLVSAAQMPEAAPGAEETIVVAHVGAAASVEIDWTPKAEGASGLEALATVLAQQRFQIDEGVTRSQVRLSYQISRAELARLVLEVPADHKVVNVLDANVRQWSVEDAGELQRIVVELFEPAATAQMLQIELERITPEAAAGEDGSRLLSVPAVRAVDASRQQGILVARVGEGMRAEVSDRVGLAQLDLADLPPELAGETWNFSFRYAALPYSMSFRVEKVEPKLSADSLVEITLEPDQITQDVLTVFDVTQGGVFRLELDLPRDFELRYVQGRSDANAQPAEIDSHRIEGDDQKRLVVNLARKATGRVAIGLRLVRMLSLPELRAPTGQPATIELELAQAPAGSVERATGRVIVHAPESLRVNATQALELRPISYAEAMVGGVSARQAEIGQARPVLSYSFADAAARLTLEGQRRRPMVTVAQLLAAHVAQGVVRYEVRLNYEILFSGVKSLRLDMPADLVESVRVVTPGVRETTIDPQPDDVAAGYVAWNLTGEAEFLGATTIDLGWEQQLSQLEVGGTIELTLPHLRPRETDRAWGQIVLAKDETIDVHESGHPTGLRPIDPEHDLMPAAGVREAARAFEFHGDYSLSISATRYELEEVKRTSIERAVVRTVVTRAGPVAVQALYRVRSVGQRLVVNLPADSEFDTDPLRINGRPVPLERGPDADYYVPLAGQTPGQPFVLELRYTMPEHAGALPLPVFPQSPAVQKVTMCVYLPEEYVCLGASGPWTDESHDQHANWFTKSKSKYASDAPLVNEVVQGIQVSGNVREAFPVDGSLLVFSTLRPEASPEGDLSLVTMKRAPWRGWSIAAVLLVGVAVAPLAGRVRWMALVAVAAGVLAIGVYLPLVLIELADVGVLMALAVVVVGWLTWGVAARRRRVAKSAAQAAAASPLGSLTEIPVPFELPEEAPPEGPSGSGEKKEEQP